MVTEQFDIDFQREVVSFYGGERYSVRDNGAVLRHSRKGSKVRPIDNQWTFGKPDNEGGYMKIASVRVHIIVATAFYGERSTKKYVVDHIDSNRRNNRAENLRWLTRLENVVKNPITRKKIEFVCDCSIEEFLATPSKHRHKFKEPNYGWMRTVSADEARTCLENMQAWISSKKPALGGSLGEWVYKQTATSSGRSLNLIEVIQSKTSNALQVNWRVPSEFPCCPQGLIPNPLAAYSAQLKIGAIFCRNDTYVSLVSKSNISDDRQSIYVITESIVKNAIKRWALAKIIYENAQFLHINLGAFFTEQGAEKQYSLNQGREWNGGDSIDDYS